MISNDSHSAGALNNETVVSALRDRLPPELSDQLPWIAQLITAIASGEISPADAQARLCTSPNYTQIQGALPEEWLTTEGINLYFRHDDISLGDIANSQTVAVGSGAIALSLILNPVFQPLPPDCRLNVGRIIGEYQDVFGGRNAELSLLDEFLTESDKPYALLLAPTGRGKTALLIHWIARIQQRGDWTVVFAPISVRFKTASEQVIYNILAYSLATVYNEIDALRSYAQTPDLLRPLIVEWLSREPPSGKQLLLVIDGMDEATGWQVGIDLFPRSLSARIKIVASARQMANRSYHDWLHDLGWRARQTAELSLPLLGRAALADIVARSDNLPVAAVEGEYFLDSLSRISQGDPLTVQFLIKALQDGDIDSEHLPGMPVGLDAFVRSWLKDLEQKSIQVASVHALLGLCAVASGPLTAEDLENLYPKYFHQRAALNQAAETVARFIIGDGSPDQGYVFSHARLRELYLERVLSVQEQTHFQQRFIEYGERCYQQIVSGSQAASVADLDKLPEYLHQFWIWHLAEANHWKRIREVLTDFFRISGKSVQLWAELRLAAEGSYSGYLSDLERLWKHARDSNDLLLSTRCALIFATLRSISGNVSPELLVRLITVGTTQGRWSPAAVIDHVRHMPHAFQQKAAIQALCAAGYDLPIAQVYEIALNIPEEYTRVEALETLAPLLPHDLLEHTLNTVTSASFEYRQGHLLKILAPYLPPDLIVRATAIARGFSHESRRFDALEVIALYLPDAEQKALSHELLEGNLALQNLDARIHGLIGLVPLLPPTLRPTVYEAVRALPASDLRVEALAALVRNVPAEEQAAAYGEALAAAKNLPNTKSLGNIVAKLLTFPPSINPEHVLGELLDLAAAVSDPQARVQVLAKLAKQLDGERRDLVLAQALEAARAIADTEKRAETLAEFLPNLPVADQMKLYGQIHKNIRSNGWLRWDRVLKLLVPHLSVALVDRLFKCAHHISYPRSLADFVQIVVPYLSPGLYVEALDLAHSIPDLQWRAQTIIAIADVIAKEHRPALYASALELMRVIADEDRRVEVLLAVAAVTPAEHRGATLEQGLSLTRTIADEYRRAAELKRLILVVADDLIPDIVSVTVALEDNYSKIDVIKNLLPRLSYPLLEQIVAAAIRSSNTSGRTGILEVIAPLLVAAPPALAQAALELARTIPDEYGRADALAKLTTLPSELMVQALEEVASFERDHNKQQVIEKFVPILPESALAFALDISLALDTEHDRAEALANLAPRLSAEKLARVLKAAAEFEGHFERTKVLKAIIPYVSQDQLQEVLELCRTSPTDYERLDILLAVAPRLSAESAREAVAIVYMEPTPEQTTNLLNTIWRLLSIKNVPLSLTVTLWAQRARALMALALRLNSPERSIVIAQAFTAARTIPQVADRADVLSKLATDLPAEDRLAVYAEALEDIQTIAVERARIFLMMPYCAYMSEEMRSEAYIKALSYIFSIKKKTDRHSISSQLVEPYVPFNLPFEVLESAYWSIEHRLSVAEEEEDPDGSDDQEQADDLGSLGLGLDSTSDALQLRAELIEFVLPHLAPEALPKLMEFVYEIDASVRVKLIEFVLPRLAPEALPKLMGLAYEIDEPDRRIPLLLRIMPYLIRSGQIFPFEAILDSLDTLFSDNARLDALRSILPDLPVPLLPKALTVIQKLSIDSDRAFALCWLIARLSGSQLSSAVMEALLAARNVSDEAQRHDLLSFLSRYIAADEQRTAGSTTVLWHSTIQQLAALGRPALLGSLAAMISWLSVLMPDEGLKAVIQIGDEVAECWP